MHKQILKMNTQQLQINVDRSEPTNISRLLASTDDAELQISSMSREGVNDSLNDSQSLLNTDNLEVNNTAGISMSILRTSLTDENERGINLNIMSDVINDSHENRLLEKGKHF